MLAFHASGLPWESISSPLPQVSNIWYAYMALLKNCGSMLEKTSLGYVINDKPIFPIVLHLRIGYMCLIIVHSHGDGRVDPSLTFPFLS